MSKVRGVIFSAEEVRAFLAGRKTQFRRPIAVVPKFVVYLLSDMGLAWRPYGGSPDVPWPAECIGEVAPYPPGSRIWVRETFISGTHSGGQPWVRYRATDQDEVPAGTHWRPSSQMPRWASRLTLEVLSVRAERLQAIGEEDARAEGCEAWVSGHGPVGHQPERTEYHGLARFRNGYEMFWEEVHGKRSHWSSDPWVWAHTVKVMS